ncbi:SHOCT domain-containing protein [Streptomyces sp. RTd22]|uniref:SHOCT domain-containing protein n=1 Tax=Streptomyces sp. RTd22 TaxID=1841249 RepID=UPI000A43DC80|nr:SHOCT domain-containing protein [Streptomyces sp. RTd22]
MMFWYDHDVSGWGWFTMSLGMILFWALIITGGVLIYRALSRPHQQPPSTAARPSPEQLLAERFARGEIDDEEYQRRLTALRTSSGPTSPA